MLRAVPSIVFIAPSSPAALRAEALLLDGLRWMVEEGAG